MDGAASTLQSDVASDETLAATSKPELDLDETLARGTAVARYPILERVGMGFGLAAVVGIPLGFLIGRFTLLNRAISPLISLLKPVSPLAWLPIGLLVFKAANPAAIWTIFICSIWPMVVNTAVGVQRVPADYLNVARVLKLPEGFGFIPKAEAAAMMEAQGNHSGPGFMGLIVGPDLKGFIAVEFAAAGYIKDEDAREWNADDMLEKMKTGTEAANAGFGVSGRFEDIAVDDFRRQFELDFPLADLSQLLRAVGQRNVLGGNGGKIFVGQCFDVIRADVANDDQCCIIGSVPGLIPFFQFIDLHVFQIAHFVYQLLFLFYIAFILYLYFCL